MPPVEKPTDLDQRVARTEANIEQLSQKMVEFVGEVRDGFNAIRGEMRESRQEQIRMHSENLTRGQAKAGNMGMWVGMGVTVLLCIAGSFASGYIRDQDRHERDIEKLRDMASEGMATDRDSAITRARLRTDVDRLNADLAAGIKGLDDKLQRETALMNQVTERATDELAKRVDGEMRWIHGAINTLDQRGGGGGLVAPRSTSDKVQGWNP